MLAVAGLVVAAVAWLGLGPARCRSLLAAIPLIGPVLRFLEIAGWARALKLLLAGDVPLSDALRKTAGVARDWKFSESVRQVADRVDAGCSLTDAAAAEELCPESLVAFLEHGERNRLLPTSLESIARICEERARQRGRWFRLMIPPIVFVIVAHCIIFSYGNAVRPMVNLLASLQ
jgi:general secretion pathway protein F